MRRRSPPSLVVNFMKQVDEGQRGEIRDRVERWSRANLPRVLGQRWFEVDALGALKHALGLRKQRPEDDQTVELREALASCRGERRARLKERSAPPAPTATPSSLGSRPTESRFSSIARSNFSPSNLGFAPSRFSARSTSPASPPRRRER